MTEQLDWQRYLSRVPSTVPPGDVLVHNGVYPVALYGGDRGSRFWLHSPSDKLEPCDCGWAPEIDVHYQVVRP